MIEWLRTKVAGRSYSEIAQAIAGKIDMPILIGWIADTIWESYRSNDLREACMKEIMEKRVAIEEATEGCDRLIDMQDFGIPDPLIIAVWSFWLFLIIIYYHNRNKPYPLGPRKD
jgi:hypothetical protein